MNLNKSEVLEITIASNFWAEGIRDALEFWSHELGIDERIKFAPFDQPVQYLLTRAPAQDGPRRLCVVLLQLERWLVNRSHVDEAGLNRNVADLLKALEQAVLRAGGERFQVLFCPATPDNPSAAALRPAEAKFAEACAATLPEVDVVTSDELERLYPPKDYNAYFDPYGERFTQNPYTPLCYATLATMVARRYSSRHMPARKVIVVDCDNTLWSGACGEVGERNVVVGPGRSWLQRFLIEQVERGRLLCLCSKNDESEVVAVFNRSPGMLLKISHLTAWRVNWLPKSENLRSLSTDLGLNLDSFIFIDDDAFECSQVQSLCREVLTIHLPQEESQIESTLLKVWELDQAPSTDEDRQRTVFYQQNAERARVRETTASLDEFLAGLELEVNFEPLRTESISRACQLMDRTNQFNLNGIRSSAGEVRAALSDTTRICEFIGARDRFGDYGIVGVTISRACSETLQVETLLLSCRALGRGIERRMMERLVATAQGIGATKVEFAYRATPKNGPMRKFFSEIGIYADNATMHLSALCALFPPIASECAASAQVSGRK